MEKLTVLQTSSHCSFYEIPGNGKSQLSRYIASTPETRRICNDPFVYGVEYTENLRTAMAAILHVLKKEIPFELHEEQAAVFHILRGGLNFHLREALHDAYGWNSHCSAFISSQRARRSENLEDWHITESGYQKIHLPPQASIIVADVVATGTSLAYALRHLLTVIESQKVAIDSILFFTIGGPRSEEILGEIDQTCREKFRMYKGSALVYLEGRFAVAAADTPVKIKFTGTDLLRTKAILSPEFLNSQYDHPTYPIERCTIYDAGSRAFWIPEYLEDVKDYWQKTLDLAEKGISYADLLRERLPEIDSLRFHEPDLKALCLSQIERASHPIHEKKMILPRIL